MKLPHIHSLRGIAIVFIVFGHAIFFQFNWTANVTTLNSLKDIFTNGTVMFVFVTGYLFQYQLVKFRWRKYLIVKLHNVITPYILVSLPAIVYACWLNDPALNFSFLAEWSKTSQVLWYYMVGGAHVNYPLWFIPMIILFFMCAPLFSCISRNPLSYLILIPLFVLSFSIHREPFPIIDPVRNTIYFLPVYITGMLACQYRHIVDPIIVKYLSVIFIVFAVILAIQLAGVGYHGAYQTKELFVFPHGYVDWSLLQKLMLCFLLIALFMKYNLSFRPLNYLADISFTVFFFHVYFYFLFNILLGYQELNGNLLNWFIRGSASLLLCVITAWLGKMILGKRSRSIIGY